METVIETIRAALAPEASAEARTAGIEACRAILTALGAPAEARPPEVGPLAHAVAGLIRTTPPDQLLDMMIEKLRAAVPAGAAAQAPRKINIPLVRIPTP